MVKTFQETAQIGDLIAYFSRNDLRFGRLVSFTPTGNPRVKRLTLKNGVFQEREDEHAVIHNYENASDLIRLLKASGITVNV